VADAAILQVIKSPSLNEKRYDFDKIWYTTAHLELDEAIFFIKFKTADDRHFKNCFIGHNTEVDCPISVKLCVGMSFSQDRYPLSHRTYFYHATRMHSAHYAVHDRAIFTMMDN